MRLFGLDCIDALYPNPLGSQGKTIQSQVNLDNPNMTKYGKFSQVHCEHTILHPGEMLFIPAFYWHQVTALDTGISANMFYGDSGETLIILTIFVQTCFYFVAGNNQMRLHFIF